MSHSLHNKLAAKREVSKIQEHIQQDGVSDYLQNGQFSSRSSEIAQIARDVIADLRKEIQKELILFIRDGTISGNLEMLSDGELEDVMCEVFSREEHPPEKAVFDEFEDKSFERQSPEGENASKPPVVPSFIPALNMNSARGETPASTARSLQDAGQLYQVEDFIEPNPSVSRSKESNISDRTPRPTRERKNDQRSSSRSDAITIIPSSPLPTVTNKKKQTDVQVQTIDDPKKSRVLVDQCTSYSTQASSAVEVDEVSHLDPSTATDTTNQSIGQIGTVKFNNVVSVRPDGSIQISSSRPSSRQQNDSLASSVNKSENGAPVRRIRVLEEDISTSALTFSDEEPEVTISCLSGRIVSSRNESAPTEQNESVYGDDKAPR